MKHYSRTHQNRHHLRPRSRGGESLESNLLWIDIEKHQSWHVIFKNLTLDEVISLLKRVKRAKDHQKKWGV